MPFRSRAQAAYFFANLPELAKKWAAETPNIKRLPDHAEKSALKHRIKNGRR